MSQENLQTMIMENFGGVKEVYYGIVQVVNSWFYRNCPRGNLVLRLQSKSPNYLDLDTGMDSVH